MPQYPDEPPADGETTPSAGHGVGDSLLNPITINLSPNSVQSLIRKSSWQKKAIEKINSGGNRLLFFHEQLHAL